jgi:hypothetical protein
MANRRCDINERWICSIGGKCSLIEIKAAIVGICWISRWAASEEWTMRYNIAVFYEDGTSSVRMNFNSLEESAASALNLADHLGKEAYGDGHGLPKFVEIRTGSIRLLSIRIFRGGLMLLEDAPKSEAT